MREAIISHEARVFILNKTKINIKRENSLFISPLGG